MLTSRQEAILSFIVERYVANAIPISSQAISRRGGFGVSSATVRNEVAVLRERGYVSNPHSSAGSVPSDRAYRLFVSWVTEADEPPEPKTTRDTVWRQLSATEMDAEHWSSTAAAILAGMVGNMAVATPPRTSESRVMHLEVVPLEGLVVMMVVVLEQARLRRHMVRLVQPVDDAELTRSANRVRGIVEGQTRRQLRLPPPNLTSLESFLLESAVLILEEEDRNLFRDHYLDGLRNLLAQPEFAENRRVRALIEGFEDGTLAQAVLEEAPEGVPGGVSGEGVLRVVIGEENRGDVLRPLSVVIGRYGGPGHAVGAIAAVGPTRMRYAHTIARVRLMTSVMTEMVTAAAPR